MGREVLSKSPRENHITPRSVGIFCKKKSVALGSPIRFVGLVLIHRWLFVSSVFTPFLALISIRELVYRSFNLSSRHFQREYFFFLSPFKETSFFHIII
jgi:hypothetical protein